ncbi:carph-isopro domain-containing protein [Roseospira visakhapatnamensis]|uniref:Transcriptional regulator with XRE-family HTH domain n=1 Tax=Roseospira visakhapatnamensis TaxID=390880 RepID=A0A7W6RH09_9PROT|nr:YdaS family helix-turn-helix protein [Roseospira visakhapatnamensis]MBB4268185.1 transcriptional regulator with XRE-family HTH domain [Roseospira visakhapatnamensis]
MSKLSVRSVNAVIDGFGGTNAMAEVCGVRASAVSNWRRTGRFPARLHLLLLSEAAQRGIDLTPADLIETKPTIPRDDRDCRSRRCPHS